MEAKKLDDGKSDWSILDLKMIEPMIAAMKHGEAKYGYDNWKGGIEDWDRRYYAAMMRHAEASQNNALKFNERDECYHLAQVAVNALIRLYLAVNEEAAHPAKDSSANLCWDTTEPWTEANWEAWRKM